MSKDKDILVILTPGFPASESDSTCLPSQQLLVKALNTNYPGMPVIILSMEYPFHRKPYLWHSNTVIPFDGWNKGRIKKMDSWIAVWRALQRLKREYHIVGLFSFWCTQCALIGKYFGRLYAIRHYIWILGQDARKDNRFIPLIRPRAEELVAMSDSLVREFYKNHRVRPAHIIPNAIDISLFDDRPVGRDIDILGVGALIPLKQYEIFIAVVKALTFRIPGIKAVICGKGQEESRLRKLIREWQLEDNVSLVGEKPHSDILQLMRRSKILLHPSSYEGYSTVCLEALYAGAHVCSFCNPEAGWVRHWHIASDRPEMEERVLEILLDPARDHEPVLIYSMNMIARSVMGLFTGPVANHNISYYNAIAEEYDAMLEKEQINKVVRQKVAVRFMEFVKEGRVLDFGGGTGLDMDWMSELPYRIIFCEPSAGMREKAIQHNRDILNNDRIHFLGDGGSDFTRWQQEIPFPDKVDGILSNFAVMNSIGDINLLFGSLSLIIKPQGHFFALVLNSDPTRSRPSLIRRKRRETLVKYKEHRQLVYLYPVKMIRKAAAGWFDFCDSESFEGSGFTLIHLVRK
jgi:glycosyltransferase involved in cell wall biosynthesis